MSIEAPADEGQDEAAGEGADRVQSADHGPAEAEVTDEVTEEGGKSVGLAGARHDAADGADRQNHPAIIHGGGVDEPAFWRGLRIHRLPV